MTLLIIFKHFRRCKKQSVFAGVCDTDLLLRKQFCMTLMIKAAASFSLTPGLKRCLKHKNITSIGHHFMMSLFFIQLLTVQLNNYLTTSNAYFIPQVFVLLFEFFNINKRNIYIKSLSWQ